MIADGSLFTGDTAPLQKTTAAAMTANPTTARHEDLISNHLAGTRIPR
jgi:hypothetical protein